MNFYRGCRQRSTHLLVKMLAWPSSIVELTNGTNKQSLEEMWQILEEMWQILCLASWHRLLCSYDNYLRVICCRIKVWYHVGVQVEKQTPSILLGVWICAIFSKDILAMTIQDVPFFELQANSGNLLGKQFVTVTNINLFNSYYLYYLSMCTIKNRLLVHSTSKSCPMYTQKAIQWN